MGIFFLDCKLIKKELVMNNLIRLVLASLKAEEGINILIKSLKEIFLEFKKNFLPYACF